MNPFEAPHSTREVPAQPRKWKFPFTLVEVAVLIALVAMFVVLLSSPNCHPAREAARRMQCENNLRQIGEALFLYAADHGVFPPAVLVDDNGRPAHSWRVLLLPYLGEKSLHSEYDFDEPWDGPNNRRLADRMPEVYCCPSAVPEGPHYMVVVGPGYFFDPSRSLSPIEVDNDTIILVEVAPSSVSWLEPVDLDFDKETFCINDPEGGNVPSSWHPGGAHVLLSDGTVTLLDDMTSADEFYWLLRHDAGPTRSRGSD